MTVLSKSLDDLFMLMPTGSFDRAILGNMRGIDHRQAIGALPINKDAPGFTFFTRPQLNLQRDNIRNFRQLASLLSSNPLSMQSYIRAILDPRLIEGFSYGRGVYVPPQLNCPLVDNKCAFIPQLTNNLISISGWPSISAPVNTSRPGLYNESQTIYDGRVLNSEAFDITANIRNTRGDGVLFLIYAWVLYGSNVFEGTLMPYLDFVTENEIDYNTRIYRLVTDYTKTRMSKISCTLASIPTGVPIGDAFDIPSMSSYLEANREISVRFASTGVRYNDDLVAKNFNEVVCIFNPNMFDTVRPNAMTKVSLASSNIFKHLCYPRIDMYTAELEWWVDNTVYSRFMAKYLSSVTETNSAAYQGD